MQTPETQRPSTADRVEALIATGKMESQVCVAQIVGVSKQRVNQIVLKRALPLRPEENTILRWPCPRCGITVRRTKGEVDRRKTKGAFCSKCAYSGDHARKNYRCCVVGCGRSHRARGYCSAHYYRLVRHGSVDAEHPIESRFAGHQGCVVKSCPEKHESLGYCRLHYLQQRYREKAGIETELPLGSV